MKLKVAVLQGKLVMVATIWLFPNVYYHVYFKMIVLWESFSTLATFVWHLSSMFLHMILKITALQESLITMCAQIWFLHSVYLWVHPRMIFLREIIFTIATFMWFLSSVSCSEKKSLATMSAWVCHLSCVNSQLYFTLCGLPCMP